MRLIPYFISFALFPLLLFAEEESKPIFDFDVVTWPEYQNVKKGELVQREVKKKKGLVSGPFKLHVSSESDRQKIELRVSAMLSRIKFPVPVSYDWEVSSSHDYVRAKGKEGSRVFCSINPKTMEIDHVSLVQVHPFAESLTKVTPETFLKYAGETYAKIFEEEAVGESSFQWDGVGMKRFQNESVDWKLVIEGVSLGSGFFKIKQTGDGLYSLSCSRNPGRAGVDQFKLYLADHPINFSQRDAMAVVFKTWKEMGELPSREAKTKAFVTCQARVAGNDNRNGPAYQSDEMNWVNSKVRDLANFPYVYEVRINFGLFMITAEVDWTSGEILWMRQGTMGW